MANCKAYLELSTLEKVEMIGKLIHAMQNDPQAFVVSKAIITAAKSRGVFDGVEIIPETNKTESLCHY